MSFSAEVQVVTRYGLECHRIEVAVRCVGPSCPVDSTPFLFDTGAEVTMVSEDLARHLKLPTEVGRTVGVTGSVSEGVGRLVPVTFRYTGEAGLILQSHWVVLPGGRGIAILGLRDVLPHFEIRTEDFDMYFLRKPSV